MDNVYVAKNEDGTVRLYFGMKPDKYEGMNSSGYWWKRHTFPAIDINEKDLPDNCKPSWKDSEPIPVSINISKKEIDS